MKIFNDPQKVQQENRQLVMGNIRDLYAVVEKLIHKSYQKKEMEINFQLRNIRSDISRVLSEMSNNELDGFSGKKGTLEELYASEEVFVGSSLSLLELANSSLLSGDMDVMLLESLLSQFEKAFNGRINIDKDILKEFKLKQMELSTESRVFSEVSPDLQNSPASIPDHPVTSTVNDIEPESIISSNIIDDVEIGDADVELGVEKLSKLYNYFNILENKYSLYKPEISNGGNYIADNKWSIDVSDKWIIGVVKGGLFKTILTFETYWHPVDDLKELVNFVQNEANAVPKAEYKSICLVNSIWSLEFQDWVNNFMHPRSMLFLYELDTGILYYNDSVDSARYLAMWHNSENEPETIEDKLNSLLDGVEYFDASDLMVATGLNAKSADKLIKEMVKKNQIIDIGFGSAKYARPKK